MQDWLIHLVIIHPYVVYGVIFVVGMVEGPILSMIGGVLLKLGFLSFWPLYVVLMLGDAVADTAWYFVGRRYGNRFIHRFGKYLGVKTHHIDTATRIFHKHKVKILFLSKVTNGLGLSMAILVSAGMVGIPFLTFLTINIGAQFIWTGGLIAIGYFFSQWYMTVNTWFERIGLIIGLCVVILAFIRLTKNVLAKDKIVAP